MWRKSHNQTNMASLSLLLLLLLFLHPTSASDLISNICEGGNYTTNSTFQSNLDLLLTSLSLTSTNSTFSNLTGGSIPYRAYGLFLCRGDINLSDCHSCIQTATQSALQICPYSKEATLWYDTCQLRYSHVSFFSSFGNERTEPYPVGPNASDPETFSKNERELISNLSNHATYRASSLMFATGEILYERDKPAIYGLVQCTRDLSGVACRQCLQELLVFFQCCDAQIEGGLLGKSCSFRYGVSKFFQGESNVYIATLTPPSAQVPSPLSPPSPISQNGEDHKTKGNRNIIIISIVISVVLAFIIIFAVCIFLRRRSATNRRGMANPEDISRNISRTESLYFDLSILKVATANFSDVNKLGQGGFGAVYKGKLPNGQDIAVKRLSANSKQGIQELKNELLLVAKLQHRNLVRLRGVCLDEGEKLLVYEYMPNGSLDNFLFGISFAEYH